MRLNHCFGSIILKKGPQFSSRPRSLVGVISSCTHQPTLDWESLNRVRNVMDGSEAYVDNLEVEKN